MFAHMMRRVAFIAIIVCLGTSSASAYEVCSGKKGDWRDLYWTNGRIKLAEDQVYALLQRDGKIVAPKCVCLDAQKSCEEAGQSRCDEMEHECNRAMNAGGQFCVQNRWGGQTCY
jgi:hypothetical protein